MFSFNEMEPKKPAEANARFQQILKRGLKNQSQLSRQSLISLYILLFSLKIAVFPRPRFTTNTFQSIWFFTLIVCCNLWIKSSHYITFTIVLKIDWFEYTQLNTIEFGILLLYAVNERRVKVTEDWSTIQGRKSKKKIYSTPSWINNSDRSRL